MEEPPPEIRAITRSFSPAWERRERIFRAAAMLPRSGRG
jgi:hypothetical protein